MPAGVSLICSTLIATFILSSVIAPQVETFRLVVRGKRGAIAAGIRFRADSGIMEAGADPRRGRYALA